jgi:hypothetical protein
MEIILTSKMLGIVNVINNIIKTELISFYFSTKIIGNVFEIDSPVSFLIICDLSTVSIFSGVNSNPSSAK